MEKINVAQFLKDCPKGMELYSPLCGDCKLYDVTDYTIRIETPNKDTLISLYHDGRYCSGGEIMLFPKGKTTWEGFVPYCKFKNGDVIVFENHWGPFISIFKENVTERNGFIGHCVLDVDDNEFDVKDSASYFNKAHLATEEEKAKLFQAIKENGYKWNAETKTLEKLVEPKFKVGDKIRFKNTKTVITITGIKDDYYLIQYYNTSKCNYQNEKISFKIQDKYELVPNKFDINTLVPFESRVLVRACNFQIWTPAFWGKYLNNDANYGYLTTNGCYKYCIPYEGNEHLLGKVGDCDKYFKTWE